MRSTASILHLDLDAFFAAVEQRDKPSLRGKPVVVGGVGTRGVVATASYEARQFGIRSAMSISEARARAPHAAYLSGRFEAYHHASGLVMGVLGQLSPIVQPLSLDEAFVDLAAADGFDPTHTEKLVTSLREQVTDVTGGLTASVGVASSKFLAKVASELNKPNGHFIVQPGTELELLGPLPIRAIPGVGPATAERITRIGIHTVEELRTLGRSELVGLLGEAQGQNLFRLARAEDNRPVTTDRHAKSISTEDTFETDIADRSELEAIVDRLAESVSARMRKNQLSCRTVTLKIRYHDFATKTRSSTLLAPTDHPQMISTTARKLLSEADLSGGLRLLGVAVSGLTDWVQDDLFTSPVDVPEPAPRVARREVRRWRPGADVHHEQHGDGWVWGSGLGLVTIRFETRNTPPGPVHTFRQDDAALSIGHRDTATDDPTDTVNS